MVEVLEQCSFVISLNKDPLQHLPEFQKQCPRTISDNDIEKVLHLKEHISIIMSQN